jgi:glutamate synthase (NADPH/NADH) large chain
MARKPFQTGLPDQVGLYDPANEHDACGVGFVVHMHGEQSHQIVRSGLEILVNLTHRGACGCDPLTGDGAGILTQIPHDFFKAKCDEAGFDLPAVGDYGMGIVFLPQELPARQALEQKMAEIIKAEGQSLSGWRDVPIDNAHIGETAREVEPYIRQVFIRRGDKTPREMFEWKLYVIRKLFESASRDAQSQRQTAYLPSLSSRVVVYKGLMLANQVEMFYLDLGDARYVSALALVHQRYSTAKSTPSVATSTGCSPARICWTATSTGQTSPKSFRSARQAPATPACSTTRSNYCC